MKKLWLLLLLGLFILFTACSEKDDDNPTGPSNQPQPPAMATIADTAFTISTNVPAEWLATITYSDQQVQAASLAHYVDKSVTDQLTTISDTTGAIDSRTLYAYQLISTDGFTPRNKHYNDLYWTDITAGYLLPSVDFRTYFPSTSIPTAFDVKNIATIKAYRVFNVVSPTDTVMFELNSLTATTHLNYSNAEEKAYKLQDLITNYVTATPANYKYRLIAVDGYSKEYTWEQIQQGYWLTQSNKTIFDVEGMENSAKKFKHIKAIELFIPTDK